MTDGVRVQYLLRERVAEEVRALLARKMMTGADLATAIGRSPMYVSRRVRGEVAFDIDDMQRLAEVFGVEVTDLMPKPTTGAPAAESPSRPPHRVLKRRPSDKHLYVSLRRPDEHEEHSDISAHPISPLRPGSTRPASAVPARSRRPQPTRPGVRPMPR